jgi:site-specific recombinase XerD
MRKKLKFKIQSLEVLTSSVSDYMLSHFLRSKVTIRNYQWVWRKLEKFMLCNKIDNYTPATGKLFLIDHFGSNCDYQKLSTSEKTFLRSIKILSEYESTGIIKPLKQEVSFHGEIGFLMQKYHDYYCSRRLAKKNMDRCERVLYLFSCYLDNNNIKCIKDITQTQVIQYIETLNPQVKSLIANTLSTLKLFFIYLFDCHHIETDLSRVIPKNNIRGAIKLPSIYTKEEIETLLKSIDRGNHLGKRNYAIVLLAARLGLRASDICHLKFENILWDKNLIVLEQCKTKRKIELPLLAETGNAIIDYLKYARPQSKETYVFLRAKSPFTRLYGTAITALVHKCLVHANINIENRRHGAHALRHSLVAALMEQKTILPVISEVLGHGNTESTKHYIRIDMESLRLCTLDVPSVPQMFYEQKGGLFYV